MQLLVTFNLCLVGPSVNPLVFLSSNKKHHHVMIGLTGGKGPSVGPGYEGQTGREMGGRGLYGSPMEYQGGQKARRDLEFENLGDKLAGVIMGTQIGDLNNGCLLFAIYDFNIWAVTKNAALGCTDSTKQECLDNQIFGLPQVHWEYVKCIRPG